MPITVCSVKAYSIDINQVFVEGIQNKFVSAKIFSRIERLGAKVYKNYVYFRQKLEKKNEFNPFHELPHLAAAQ